MSDLPEWALERAAKLSTAEPWEVEFQFTTEHAKGNRHQRAFARYIAAHEEPPVDPLRAALDDAFEATKLLTDTRTHRDRFTAALREALSRRGIELAKSENADV